MAPTGPQPNNNGPITIVFTYSGELYTTYNDFINAFSIELGYASNLDNSKNYYAYNNTSAQNSSLSIITALPLKTATSNLYTAINDNAASLISNGLSTALDDWLINAASTGIQSLGSNVLRPTITPKNGKTPKTANIANFDPTFYATGGRIYVNYGNNPVNGLTASSQPNFWSTPTWSAFIEPYVASNLVNNLPVPANNADLTDIDQFAFPLSLNLWGYDSTTNQLVLFDKAGNVKSAASSGTAYKTPTLNGGNGTNLWNSLKSTTTGSKSNQNNSGPIVAPGQAGNNTAYYQATSSRDFPYHYFEDYLVYLSSLAQTHTQPPNGFSSKPGVTGILTDTFAGSNESSAAASAQFQEFNVSVDFSHIKLTPLNFTDANGKLVNSNYISTDSYIGINGSSKSLVDGGGGTGYSKISLQLPWFQAAPGYTIQQSTTQNAITQNWLTAPTTVPATAKSESYLVNATVKDSASNTLTPSNQPQGGSLQPKLQLTYSYSAWIKKNVWPNNGGSPLVTPSQTTGLIPSIESGQGPFTIITDNNGNLTSITLNNDPNDGSLYNGAVFTNIDTGSSFTINSSPTLQSVFITTNDGAIYPSQPAVLTAAVGQGASQDTINVSLNLTASGAQSAASQYIPDTGWTTLSMPGGIWGANSGYTGTATDSNGNDIVINDPAVGNDLWGRIVGDTLAALNVGFFGSTTSWTPPGSSLTTTVGEALNVTTGSTAEKSKTSWWFNLNDPQNLGNYNPYVGNAWGPKAWVNASTPPTDYWNTWAYGVNQNTTEAYNFGFTDRFVNGIDTGLNPPAPSGNSPQPIFAEVVIGDSPGLSQQAALHTSLFRQWDPIIGLHNFTLEPSKQSGVTDSVPEGSTSGYQKSYQTISATNPVWWLTSPSGQNFYTASQAEKDGLQKSGFHYEKIAFYAKEASSPTGSIAVQRFFNPSTGDHLWTSDAGEISSLTSHPIGYINEGVGFYI